MELLITIANGQAQDLIHLNSFILARSPEGLDNSEIINKPQDAGAMGIGVFLGIKAIIQSASKPLVELIKCLQKYVDNYRTEIKIKANGKDIVIKKGRSMSAEELTNLVTEILKS